MKPISLPGAARPRPVNSPVTTTKAIAAPFHKRLLILGCVLGMHSVASAATYYVSDSTGNDTTYNGLATTTPFKTIQRGLNALAPGDTLNIMGGTYRQGAQLSSTGANGTAALPITIKNYNSSPVYIKGSTLHTGGWTQVAGTSIWWKSIPNRAQQVFCNYNDASPAATQCLSMVGNPGPAFNSADGGMQGVYRNPVGGNWFPTEAQAMTLMTAGSFWWNSANGRLYVWNPGNLSPNTANMQVSCDAASGQWNGQLLVLKRAFTTVSGLNFAHSAISNVLPQKAAVELDASNCKLSGVTIRYTDCEGLSLGYNRVNNIVENSYILDNGILGISAAASMNYKVTNCTIARNNYRGFYVYWHAGGFKSTSNVGAGLFAYGTLSGNEIADNYGSGLWTDYVQGPNSTIVERNYLHHNGKTNAFQPAAGVAAIYLEVANNHIVRANLLANNAGRGIYMACASNSGIYNNTIVGQTGNSSIEMDLRNGVGGFSGNKIYNNIVSGGTTTLDVMVRANGSVGCSNNDYNWNLVYRAGGEKWRIRFDAYDGVYNGWSQWDAQAIFGLNDRNGNPGFTVGSGENYTISSSSPAAGTGTNVTGVPTQDYNLANFPTARPMGAFAAAAPGVSLLTTQLPSVISNSNGPELGVILKSSVAGKFTAVRIYTNGEAAGVHNVRIWNNTTGAQVLSTTWNITDTSTGWKQSPNFATPVPVTAGVDYTVSVSTTGAGGSYARRASGFGAAITNGVLSARVGAGVYGAAGARPQLVESNSNYFRDVVFVAD